MTKTDLIIYKAILALLKDGISLSKSSIARKSNLSRKTINNKIEKYTFQNLNKFKKVSHACS